MSKNLTNNQLLMRECIKQEFDESQIYADQATFFEYFSISQVFKNYDLSVDDIDDGLTGGGNDGGCDGLYLFLNEELITQDQVANLSAIKGSILKFCIVQAKNTIGFNEDSIMKFKTISENLLVLSHNLDDYNSRYNDRILDKFRLFRDVLTKLLRSQVKINFQFYDITLATEIHPNVQQQSEELKALIKKEYPSSLVEVKFVGADDLMDLYNTDTESRVNITLSDQPIALGEKLDYIALVNLKTYYKFITDENQNIRKSFFESNVRDYQGKNSVNNSIAETLLNPSKEDFWWLNNGVTILASKITPITTRELQLENPKIVNGLQTSTEIFNYFSKNNDLDDEKRNILVRLIVPETEESRDNIIFATNNQTSIPKSSLRVTDTIHLQIEMYFKNRGLYYDRRKNQYKNLKKKSKDIVSVSFLAQCLITIILKKPDFARARPSTLLTDDDTYEELYGTNIDLEVYYKAALLGKKVQNNLRNTLTMTPAERSDILFYLLYAVVASVLNKREISFNDIKSMDIEKIDDKLIDEMKEKIFNKYKQLGGNGRVAKSSSFIQEIDDILFSN